MTAMKKMVVTNMVARVIREKGVVTTTIEFGGVSMLATFKNSE